MKKKSVLTLLISRFRNRKQNFKGLESFQFFPFKSIVWSKFRVFEDNLDQKYIRLLESQILKNEFVIDQKVIETKNNAFEKLNQIKVKLSEKIKTYFSNNNSFKFSHVSNLQQNVNSIISFRSKLLAFVKIYNESLENIVEGQREVLQNEDLKLWDGETVKHKEANFAAKMHHFKQIMGK